MFSEEREWWNKFFDVFKKHFKEEVGLSPSVYETDEVEIDFIIGEESDQLLGVQVIFQVSDDELDEDEEEEDEEEKEAEEEEDKDEDEDEEEDEEDSEYYDMIYIFSKTDKKVEDIKGTKQFEIDFPLESEGEEQQIHLEFYADEEEEITGLVVQVEDQEKEVFLEELDFDF